MKYLITVVALLSIGTACNKPIPVPPPPPPKPTVVTIPTGKQVTVNCPTCNHEIRVNIPECNRVHVGW